MKRKAENLKRATEVEAMAEVAVSRLEKDALLRVAEGLLNQVYKPAEPSQGDSEHTGLKPKRGPAGAKQAATCVRKGVLEDGE